MPIQKPERGDYEIEEYHYANDKCNEVKQPNLDEIQSKRYLGHFAQEKFVKEGHNTMPELGGFGLNDPFSGVSPSQKKKALDRGVAMGMNPSANPITDAVGGALKREDVANFVSSAFASETPEQAQGKQAAKDYFKGSKASDSVVYDAKKKKFSSK